MQKYITANCTTQHYMHYKLISTFFRETPAADATKYPNPHVWTPITMWDLCSFLFVNDLNPEDAKPHPMFTSHLLVGLCSPAERICNKLHLADFSEQQRFGMEHPPPNTKLQVIFAMEGTDSQK
jgi:hypothetical protein